MVNILNDKKYITRIFKTTNLGIDRVDIVLYINLLQILDYPIDSCRENTFNKIISFSPF